MAPAGRSASGVLTLPVPPSSNTRLRPGRNRAGGLQFYNTSAYRIWLEGAQLVAMGARFRRIEPPAEVVVTITWYRGAARGDLANREKPVCDVLRGLAYRDDAQIAELHLVRVLDRRRPRLEVTVARLPGGVTG
jgi:Holliday junction resolvase RusA-like endonuclease